MNTLTLQWQDAGQDKTQQIYEQQPSKNYDTIRLTTHSSLLTFKSGFAKK